MSPISEHYRKVMEKVVETLKKAGRPLDSARVLAVTKGQSVSSIQQLIALGQTRFGENYAQEWESKEEILHSEPLPLEWHFIGRLQTNKVKKLVGAITLFHSIDRLELALKINHVAGSRGLVCQGLIELNLGSEASKGGIKERDLKEFFEKLRPLSHLSIKGLMILPPYFEEKEKSRPYFKRLRELLEDLNRQGVYREPLRELSMGTSHDFDIALEEGASWIRVGRILF